MRITIRDAVCPEITNILQETHIGLLVRENFQEIMKVICEKNAYATKMCPFFSFNETLVWRFCSPRRTTARWSACSTSCSTLPASPCSWRP